MSCVSENTYIVQKGGDVPFLTERSFREASEGERKNQKGGKSKKPKSKKAKSKKNKRKSKRKGYWK